LQETAYENLKRHILPGDVFRRWTEVNFRAAVQQTAAADSRAGGQLIDQVGAILKLRQEIQNVAGPARCCP